MSQSELLNAEVTETIIRSYYHVYNSLSALLEINIREFQSSVNSFSLVGVRA